MGSVNEMGEGVRVEIGGMPIFLRTEDAGFQKLLRERYAGFLDSDREVDFEFDIDLQNSSAGRVPDEDVKVTRQGSHWLLRRGDFLAQWDPSAGRGSVCQSRNTYSMY